MLEVVLPPLIGAYVVFVAMVVIASRRPLPPRDGPDDPASRASRGGIVATTLGGYATFLVIVLIFHVWLAGEADASASALWGGAFLSAIALGLAAATRVLRRRGAPHR